MKKVSEVLGRDFGAEFVVGAEGIAGGVDEAGCDETDFADERGTGLGGLDEMQKSLAVVEDGGLGGFVLGSGLTAGGGKKLEGSC